MAPLTPEQQAIRAQQIADGKLPADAPEDFVIPEDGLNENGQPWWFPPGFTIDPEFWGPTGPPQGMPDGTPVTRRSLADEGFRVQAMSRPIPITPPPGIWTDTEMAMIRAGHFATVMEDKWHIFTENDCIYFTRSWTGFCIYEADFARCDGGWTITACRVTTDTNMYVIKSSRWESLNLEYLIRAALLSQDYDEVEGRLGKSMAVAERSPRIVITEAKGPPMAITKPGYSIKHGKVADQHPLQRDAYDESFTTGHRTAWTALAAKGRSVQDVYHAAWRHEEKAKTTFGVESSQHAGLARGAKVAAWEHLHGSAQ
jgi:hypothetical protein